MSKDDLLKIEEAPAPLRPVRERSGSASTSRARHHRISAASVPWAMAAARLRAWRGLRDAVSDDELLVMASITHQRPPAPGASSKNARSFSVPRTVHPALSRRSAGPLWNPRPDRR